MAVVIGSYYVFHSDWYKKGDVDAQEVGTQEQVHEEGQMTQEEGASDGELMEDLDATPEVEEYIVPPFSEAPVINSEPDNVEALENVQSVEIEEVLEDLDEGFVLNPTAQAGSAYISRSKAGSIYFDAEGMIFQFIVDDGSQQQSSSQDDDDDDEEVPVKVFNLMAEFEGAQSTTMIGGESEKSYESNFFLGENPNEWKTEVKNYEKLHYDNIYPGIDLNYEYIESQLKYEFVVQPGGLPMNIRIHYNGADNIEIDENGDLLVYTAIGTYREEAPYIYQEVGGQQQEVGGGFQLLGNNTIGFWTGSYDSNIPLVIDPVVHDDRLAYGSYFGTSGNDNAENVVFDEFGDAYVSFDVKAGFTMPSVPGFDQIHANNSDYLILKIDGETQAIEFATYLGGGGKDFDPRIDVDSNGVYIAGLTQSGNYPTTAGAYDATKNPSQDIAISKLSTDGTALIYSSYLGGDTQDRAFNMVVNDDGEMLITGNTNSTDFPVTAGAVQAARSGNRDAIVVRFNPGGNGTSDLRASTHHGGSGREDGNAIDYDGDGNIYVVGETRSADYPTTGGAYDTALGGGRDVFIASFDNKLTTRNFSTYLGGTANDTGSDFYVEPNGRLLITGKTRNGTFPVTGGAIDTTHNGNFDIFMALFNGDTQSVEYATFLGGSGGDSGEAIFRDEERSVYIAGTTSSADYPTTALAFDTTHNGSDDIAITKIDATLQTILYSSYLGGTGDDTSDNSNIAMYPGDDKLWIPSTTTSTDAPLTANAYQGTLQGNDEAALHVLYPVGSGWQLTFENEPIPVEIEEPFMLQVNLLDVSGQKVTSDGSTPVALTLNSATGNTMLGGATQATTQNGVATFNALSIDEAGLYTITATNNLLTVPTVTTQTFEVTTVQQKSSGGGGGAGGGTIGSTPVNKLSDFLGEGEEEDDEELHESAEEKKESSPNAPNTSDTSSNETSSKEEVTEENCQRDDDTPVLFTDIKGHWAEEVIKYWFKRCVVNGKNAETFGPDDTIIQNELNLILERALGYSSDMMPMSNETKDKPMSRLEFLKTLMVAKGSNIPDGSSTFADIAANNPNSALLGYAQQMGLIEGYQEYTDGDQLVSDSYRFPRLLGEGNEGDDVADLQKVMANFGYYQGEIDGVYDGDLADALRKYQESADIKPVGQMGPITRRAILAEKIRTQMVSVFMPDSPITRAEALKLLKLCEKL